MQQFVSPIFRVSVLVIVLFQVAALIARSAIELSLVDQGYPRALAKDLSYLVVPPILLVLMFPYLRRCKDSLLALLRPADLTIRLIFLSILLGVVLRVTYWASITLLISAGVIGNDDPNAIVGPLIGFDCPPLPVLLLSFVVVSFLIPIVEEVGNRGFIFHALLPRGIVMSVIVSAVLFAVMHNPHSYIVAFCGGVIFAIQMLNYRTLWAPILTHASYNAATVIDWECFRIQWNPQPSDPGFLIAAGISAPVALIGACVALYLISKRAAGAGKAPRRV